MNDEEIVCTLEHPFYSPVKGWTAACRLRAGDILVTVNGEYVILEKIQHELLESPETTYNFEVADFHTYYVGDTEVLVHNSCNHNTSSWRTQKSNYWVINKETKMKELFDYVAGKMSHDEFEAELYINPDLWNEIQSLVPEDIADPNCPFRKLWGNMQLLETENYKIKSAVTVFGYKSYLAYGLVKALILYHYPNAVCREPPDDSPLDVLEKIRMDYIGGNEVDDLIREYIAKAANRKELKKTLSEAFPCVPRKHPDWVQEPEWPTKDGAPMKFISQSHTGEKYEYTFQAVDGDEVRIVEQYL